MNCSGFFPIDGVGDKMEEESKEQSGTYIEYFSDYLKMTNCTLAANLHPNSVSGTV